MLDFGIAELLVIVAIAVMVIGPKEIPAMMHGLGRIVRRLQYVRYALSQQFDDFMKDQDLDEIRKSVNFEALDFDEAAEDEEFMKPVKKTTKRKKSTKGKKPNE